MESKYREIYKDLISGENQFNIIIPNYARDSYSGNLMTISHYVKVTFFTQGGRLVMENPSLKIPVIIGYAKEEEEKKLGGTTTTTGEQQQQRQKRNKQETAAPRIRKEEERPITPIATVLIDEEILEPAQLSPSLLFCDDESTITVGTGAITNTTTNNNIPMANAIFFNEEQTKRLLGEVDDDDNDGYDDDVSYDNNYYYDKKTHNNNNAYYSKQSKVSSMITPSAPDESLLIGHKPPKFQDHVQDFGGGAIPKTKKEKKENLNKLNNNNSSSNNNTYSPYKMYVAQTQTRRPMRIDYSYEDSDISTFQDSIDERSPSSQSLRGGGIDGHGGAAHSNFIHERRQQQERQQREENERYGTSTTTTTRRRDEESKKLLVRLIRELQGSIHDYEVILMFARSAEYRALFSSLTS